MGSLRKFRILALFLIFCLLFQQPVPLHAKSYKGKYADLSSLFKKPKPGDLAIGAAFTLLSCYIPVKFGNAEGYFANFGKGMFTSSISQAAMNIAVDKWKFNPEAAQVFGYAVTGLASGVFSAKDGLYNFGTKDSFWNSHNAFRGAVMGTFKGAAIGGATLLAYDALKGSGLYRNNPYIANQVISVLGGAVGGGVFHLAANSAGFANLGDFCQPMKQDLWTKAIGLGVQYAAAEMGVRPVYSKVLGDVIGGSYGAGKFGTEFSLARTLASSGISVGLNALAGDYNSCGYNKLGLTSTAMAGVEWLATSLAHGAVTRDFASAFNRSFANLGTWGGTIGTSGYNEAAFIQKIADFGGYANFKANADYAMKAGGYSSWKKFVGDGRHSELFSPLDSSIVRYASSVMHQSAVENLTDIAGIGAVKGINAVRNYLGVSKEPEIIVLPGDPSWKTLGGATPEILNQRPEILDIEKKISEDLPLPIESAQIKLEMPDPKGIGGTVTSSFPKTDQSTFSGNPNEVLAEMITGQPAGNLTENNPLIPTDSGVGGGGNTRDIARPDLARDNSGNKVDAKKENTQAEGMTPQSTAGIPILPLPKGGPMGTTSDQSILPKPVVTTSNGTVSGQSSSEGVGLPAGVKKSEDKSGQIISSSQTPPVINPKKATMSSGLTDEEAPLPNNIIPDSPSALWNLRKGSEISVNGIKLTVIDSKPEKVNEDIDTYYVKMEYINPDGQLRIVEKRISGEGGNYKESIEKFLTTRDLQRARLAQPSQPKPTTTPTPSEQSGSVVSQASKKSDSDADTTKYNFLQGSKDSIQNLKPGEKYYFTIEPEDGEHGEIEANVVENRIENLGDITKRTIKLQYSDDTYKAEGGNIKEITVSIPDEFAGGKYKDPLVLTDKDLKYARLIDSQPRPETAVTPGLSAKEQFIQENKPGWFKRYVWRAIQLPTLGLLPTAMNENNRAAMQLEREKTGGRNWWGKLDRDYFTEGTNTGTILHSITGKYRTRMIEYNGQKFSNKSDLSKHFNILSQPASQLELVVPPASVTAPPSKSPESPVELVAPPKKSMDDIAKGINERSKVATYPRSALVEKVVDKVVYELQEGKLTNKGLSQLVYDAAKEAGCLYEGQSQIDRNRELYGELLPKVIKSLKEDYGYKLTDFIRLSPLGNDLPPKKSGSGTGGNSEKQKTPEQKIKQISSEDPNSPAGGGVIKDYYGSSPLDPLNGTKAIETMLRNKLENYNDEEVVLKNIIGKQIGLSDDKIPQIKIKQTVIGSDGITSVKFVSPTKQKLCEATINKAGQVVNWGVIDSKEYSVVTEAAASVYSDPLSDGK